MLIRRRYIWVLSQVQRMEQIWGKKEEQPAEVKHGSDG
jgi:hypothetical protein